jgi:hypothetical protein
MTSTSMSPAPKALPSLMRLVALRDPSLETRLAARLLRRTDAPPAPEFHQRFSAFSADVSHAACRYQNQQTKTTSPCLSSVV